MGVSLVANAFSFLSFDCAVQCSAEKAGRCGERKHHFCGLAPGTGHRAHCWHVTCGMWHVALGLMEGCMCWLLGCSLAGWRLAGWLAPWLAGGWHADAGTLAASPRNTTFCLNAEPISGVKRPLYLFSACRMKSGEP